MLTLKVTRKIVSFSTLDRLCKKQVGTNEIEALAQKIFRNKRFRNIGFINFVMRQKKEDSASELVVVVNTYYSKRCKNLIRI